MQISFDKLFRKNCCIKETADFTFYGYMTFLKIFKWISEE